jgi:hypothetical protein
MSYSTTANKTVTAVRNPAVNVRLNEIVSSVKEGTRGTLWSHHWLLENGVAVAFVKTSEYYSDGIIQKVVLCDLEVRNPGKGYAREATNVISSLYNVDTLYTTSSVTEAGCKFVKNNTNLFTLENESSYQRKTLQTLTPNVEDMVFVKNWDTMTSEFNL